MLYIFSKWYRSEPKLMSLFYISILFFTFDKYIISSFYIATIIFIAMLHVIFWKGINSFFEAQNTIRFDSILTCLLANFLKVTDYLVLLNSCIINLFLNKVLLIWSTNIFSHFSQNSSELIKTSLLFTSIRLLSIFE